TPEEGRAAAVVAGLPPVTVVDVGLDVGLDVEPCPPDPHPLAHAVAVAVVGGDLRLVVRRH
ncbi:MAG: hypothetical protein HOQ18_14190, partial [Dermatophilaceae bacterium]|nr:hypothetical protein [Dermatophilaceae bacterium]